MKQCSKCKKLLPEDYFSPDKRVKSGLQSICRKCHYIFYSECSKRWKGENKEKIKSCRKKWNADNPLRLKNYHKVYRQKYKKEIRDYQREWKIKNPEKVRAGIKKRRLNPKNRLDDSISESIRKVLRGKKAGRKWEILTGYKLENLITHLEKQFDDKMSWDNYGSYWEIDHIQPKSLFHYEEPEDIEFRKCWALENLQPLEKLLNRKKYNKVQPSPI